TRSFAASPIASPAGSSSSTRTTHTPCAGRTNWCTAISAPPCTGPSTAPLTWNAETRDCTAPIRSAAWERSRARRCPSGTGSSPRWGSASPRCGTRVCTCDTNSATDPHPVSLGELVHGLADAFLRDGVRRAEGLGEEADPQLLQHPADLDDRLLSTPGGREL